MQAKHSMAFVVAMESERLGTFEVLTNMCGFVVYFHKYIEVAFASLSEVSNMYDTYTIV